MALNGAPIYLSSFLLERNRWNGKGPSLLVSEFVEFIAEAGFRGLEIWAPHLSLASRSEWDAIREKAGESDLPVVFLSAALPMDASDKSRRQRDFLVEAADYFGPQGIKFSLTGREGDDEKLSILGQWAGDLPRALALVPVCGDPGADPALARKLRERLGARFRCSVNPFSLGAERFEGWFREAGDALMDFGIRVQSGGKYDSLRGAEEACFQVVSSARRLGFKGSWTLECTKGAGAPAEDADSLLDEAEEDLNFLMEILESPSPPHPPTAPR